MAAITSSVIGVGLAAYQVSSAAKEKKDAKEAIKDFKPQDLNNPF